MLPSSHPKNAQPQLSPRVAATTDRPPKTAKLECCARHGIPLARRLDTGTARIMSATVRRDGGRWHVAFTVNVEHTERMPTRPDSLVGVDVGITHLAVLSTGEMVPNPRHLTAAQDRFRALGRALSRKTGPDRRTGRRPSKRWERAAGRLGRAHARVGNPRRDGLHKLTTRLATTHGTIVVEDLNVTGMLANPPH